MSLNTAFTIKLKSGRLVGDPAFFKENLAAVLRSSVRKGQERALRIFMPTVPKKSGRLRNLLRKMYKLQIRNRKTKFTIKIQMSILNQQPYPKYHIREHPAFNPKFSGGYKNPTTPGTKPLSVEEQIGIIHAEIADELNTQLKAKGFKFRFRSRGRIVVS